MYPQIILSNLFKIYNFFFFFWFERGRERAREIPEILFRTIYVHMCFFLGRGFIAFFSFSNSLCPRPVASYWCGQSWLSCPGHEFYDLVAILELLSLYKMTVGLILSWMIYFPPGSKTYSGMFLVYQLKPMIFIM